VFVHCAILWKKKQEEELNGDAFYIVHNCCERGNVAKLWEYSRGLVLCCHVYFSILFNSS
jgi:hypothetical protein